MEFEDVVRRRKMVRDFEDRPIPEDVVQRLIRNALRAPSAGFSQGWSFLVLRGQQERERYWRAHRGPGGTAYAQHPLLFNAPLIVVCFSNERMYVERYDRPDKRQPGGPPHVWTAPFWHIDTGMAALMILLTAVDAGLGAVFIEVPRQEAVRTEFGVPADYTAIGTIVIGYPSPRRSMPVVRRPRDEGAVHHERW